MRLIARLTTAVLIAASCILVQAAEIKGKITNAAGGEPLGQIQVSLPELKMDTTTKADGTFVLDKVPVGNFTLRLSAVGYRLMSVSVVLTTVEDVHEFSLVMVPDNFRRTESVEVKADVFQAEDSPAVVEENLTSSEIRAASTVLADDPFRAVQALPGVSASGNNELLAQFSVMGAPFTSIGVYLDDVLVPDPFHQDQNVANAASLSLLTGELVEEMKLLPVAYPERFGDHLGAALDIRTRDGSRSGPLFRASVGLGYTDGVGEGRLGPGKRGSWLASVRKSYLGYLVHNLIASDFADISFYDGEGKLTYDLTPRHSVSFYFLGGHTNIDDTSAKLAGDISRTQGDLFLYRGGWRWNASSSLLIDSRLAYLREPGSASDPSGRLLFRNAYSEWSGGTHALWAWNRNATFEAGGMLRHATSNFTSYSLNPSTPPQAALDHAWYVGNGYLQQSASLFSNRLQMLGGVRMDAQEKTSLHPVSPQAAAAFQVARATQLQFGFGRYAVLYEPFIQGSASPVGGCSSGGEFYERSNHFTAAVEQRLGESTRVRLQWFDRQNSVLESVKLASPCPGALFPGQYTIEESYSRGAQVVLQRRSANRLSGWIGYTFVQAKRRNFLRSVDPAINFFSPYYVSDTDQPNSVNAFATYRLRPTISFSSKFIYGSGFPVTTGFQLSAGSGVQLTPVVRLPDYLRADFRVDKSWAFTRWKMTLYSEVLNFTNHHNVIVISTTYETNGQVVVKTQRALPVTPTVGMAFEF